MKIEPSKYFSRILTGLIAAAASFALPLVAQAQISAFPFNPDGKFTGFGGGPALAPGSEWSDITPFAFNSVPGFSAAPAAFGPGANTALYAAISHNVLTPLGDLQLHLLYDFLPRTTPPLPGETFATVTFPITLGTRPKSDISVLFVGLPAGGPNFFDVFVDLLDGVTPLIPAASLGISRHSR